MLPYAKDGAWDGADSAEAEPLGSADKRRERAILEGLRAVLRRDPASIDLPRAAEQLGTSTRTLQRALTSLGTTFRRELGSARIQRARERLERETVALTTIALDLGYGSLQSFDRHFRRLMGVTPGTFRRQSRDSVK